MPSKYKKHIRNLKHIKMPTFFRITNRIIGFMFSFSLILFLFYLAGNYQGFLAKNQIIILTVLSYVSVSLVFFCICGIVEIFIFSYKEKNSTLMKFILLYILVSLIGVINASIGSIITFISH
ncbi:MAG: hypothetical protein BKP49_01785 [Treponema sp. CETP13]|nr:MAG: hypothetical protein BKP49_01785 [Treponema sp. CETP13]